MFQPGLFEGKTVLVTGGGSGIGKAISKQFLQLGAKVFIASRKLERLEQAIEELQNLGDCTFFELNIRDIESVKAGAAFIKDEAGKVDILINNAGGQFPSAAEAISTKVGTLLLTPT
jgi:citronellol/citronellal dehydrogenase